MTESRDTRRKLVKQLEQIRYLRVIPTQANYVIFEEGILLKNLTAGVANGQ